MTQQEFERKIVKLLPVTHITYGRHYKGKKFSTKEVYVHYGLGKCKLTFGENCLADMIKQLEIK